MRPDAWQHKLLIIRSILLLLCTNLFRPLSAQGEAASAQFPARILKEYALVSAYAREKYPDPRNWRLLGSNDDGATWTQLDVQTNQVFQARSQRRVYRLKNEKAYRTYRLIVEGSANVQLAELELIGPWVGVTNEADVQVVATASKEHPLLGAAIEAFDNDPTSRWIDFGTGQTNCWLQCQYSLNSPVVLSNVAQFTVVARRLAAHNPLGEKAGKVLASFNQKTSRPARVLSGYALTSANDIPARDPLDWRLLGSNDHGETWQTLDVRHNEIFPQRFERRIFFLTNETSYTQYRLQIDCVRVPADLPGGATCVQLAEIEPLYSAKDPGGSFTMLVSAEGENPPLEAVEDAFDGKARTKWLSFTDDNNNKRSSWVQWEYLPGGEPAVVNLRWVKALLAQRPVPVDLQLQGVIVSWEPGSRTLGFVDESGFQSFRLGSPVGEVQPGDRVRLSGCLQVGREVPLVTDSQLTVLKHVGDSPEQIQIGQILTASQNLFPAEVEGLVTSVSEDSAGWTTLGLAPDNKSERMRAKIHQESRRVRFFPGCRLQMRGVIEAMLADEATHVAGTIWVADLNQVRILAANEKDWKEWPLLSVGRLARTNTPIAAGSPIRIHANLIRQEAETLVLAERGTNIIRVPFKTEAPLPSGAQVEAIGFFLRENGSLSLERGLAREFAQIKTEPATPNGGQNDTNETVTLVRRVYERLQETPGKPFAVNLRGVITYIDLEFDSFYLQDENDGITVVNQLDAGLAPLIKQEGSYIEVRGTVDPDLQAIVPEGFVRVLGKGRMPEPRRHSWDYLITGKDDSQWVQVEGVVSACGDAGLTLIVTGGRLGVVVNDFDQRSQDRLLGSLVRINGVCQPLRDNRNRRIGLQLLVPFTDCIEVLRAAPEDPFDLATRKIAELDDRSARSTNMAVRLVKTVGVVTYKEPKVLFLQDGNDGLRVLLRAASGVTVGDRVEAVGFAEPDGFSPKLVQAVVRKIAQDALPPANPLDLMGPDVSDADATRVQIEATVVGQKAGKLVQALELNDDRSEKTFSAFVPVAAEELPVFPIGSKVRLRGVFRSEMETMADLGKVPTTFQLYVNGLQDITVLNRPSWWTARHTLWVSAGLGTILLMALAWASLLRSQVHQRTEQLRVEIAEHKQTEVALETSERFMRSLMESLPQSIVRKDLEGRFTFANEFFCRTIGKPMEQVVGKTDFDLFPNDLATKFRRDDQQVIATGKQLETVEQNRNASGQNIFVQVIKAPLFDGANQVTGVQIIFWDVTERKQAEARLEEAQRAMVDASRQAGMAEVAAGVLHNVGNVLNSVNVSVSLLSDKLQKSKTAGLTKAVGLLHEQENDLAGFFTRDPRGKQLTSYLGKLAECLSAEQSSAMQEVQTLRKNVEHIKEIVAMQQSYAKIVGVTEKVQVTDLVEDALRLNSGTLARHEVELTRDYAPKLPEIIVERHKVLQILVNLIRNAKYACDESGRHDKRLVVRVSHADGCVNISTSDNGVGIPAENLTRIFNHGFTTRKDGHGFGLHSGALAAKEMGGTLVAQSEGPGKGATFVLSLPISPIESPKNRKIASLLDRPKSHSVAATGSEICI